MQFNVYQGGTLAATFEYGSEPRYFGTAGERLKVHVVSLHNAPQSWTDDAAFEWIDRLADAGYTIYATFPIDQSPFTRDAIH